MGKPEKYTVEQRKQIVAWFTLGYPIKMVQQQIEDKFGIVETNQPGIWRTYHPNSKECAKKWKRYSRFLQNVLFKRLHDVPLAVKENRIRELQRVYSEALTWRTKSISEQGEVQEIKLDAATRALNAIRVELEGERGSNVNVNVQVNMIDGLKMVEKRRKELEAERNSKLGDSLVRSNGNGHHNGR